MFPSWWTDREDEGVVCCPWLTTAVPQLSEARVSIHNIIIVSDLWSFARGSCLYYLSTDQSKLSKYFNFDLHKIKIACIQHNILYPNKLFISLQLCKRNLISQLDKTTNSF